jgi:crotonobetainyl-CoA:carnitine CoA-transferase CaiB-like acyl-CoA transferase
VGILAALQERQKTGLGQRVEVNLLSSLLSGLVNQSAGLAGAGFVPGIMGNRHPSIAPYESYPTADRQLVIAVGNDRQFRACAEVLGAPGWADDERFASNPARVANREALYAAMVGRLATAGAEYWFKALTAVGVPAGPINDIADAFALAERLGLEPVADAAGEPTVASPLRFSRTPVTYRKAPPGLDDGEDVTTVQRTTS